MYFKPQHHKTVAFHVMFQQVLFIMSCKTNNVFDCTELFIQLSILPNQILTLCFLLTGLHHFPVLTFLALLELPAFVNAADLMHLVFHLPCSWQSTKKLEGVVCITLVSMGMTTGRQHASPLTLTLIIKLPNSKTCHLSFYWDSLRISKYIHGTGSEICLRTLSWDLVRHNWTVISWLTIHSPHTHAK